jgi:hypothetical protein
VPSAVECILLDDFESYAPGEPPFKWRTSRDREELIPLTAEGAMNDRKHFYVRSENGNQFVRGYTRDKAIRVILSSKDNLRWNVQDKPYLRWRWRAQELPEGASEKDQNDTGGAVYVTFERNWLGLPRSIKYTYSSSLEPGTVVEFGKLGVTVLKVIVVASKPTDGTGDWISHERNVLKDYKRLYGGEPKENPLAVMMWSDSDTTSDTATVDYDDIMVLSGPSLEQQAVSSE